MGFEYSEPPAIALLEYSIFSLSIWSRICAGRFLQLASRVALIVRERLPREVAELLLDVGDLSAHVAFLLRQLLHPRVARVAGAVEPGHLLGHLALLAGQIVGLPLQILDVLAGLLRLIVLQQPLGFLKALRARCACAPPSLPFAAA